MESGTLVCRQGSSIVYKAAEEIPIPDIDLLSFLFDSEHCSVKEDSILHIDANDPSQQLTKGELRQWTKRIAATLRDGYQVREGKCVTSISSNSIFIPAVFYGCIAAGGVYTPASPSSTKVDLARIIKSVGSDVVICSPDKLQTALAACQECCISLDRLLIVEPNRQALVSYQSGQNVMADRLLDWDRCADPNLLESTPVCIIFSSGTTGLPKGTPITHRNIVAQTLCCWGLRHRQVQLKAPDFEFRTLAHLPVAHIAGITNYFLSPFIMAGPVYWMGRFDFSAFIECHRRFRITFLLTVPSICLQIVNSSQVTNHFDHVTFAIAGAAPMGPELQVAVGKKLGKGHTAITQTYGMSEVAGNICGLGYGERDLTASAGRLLPSLQARIVDDDGSDAEPGSSGELLLKGPCVIKGYHQVTPSAGVFDKDGWFLTGDIVRFSKGLFYVEDRKKDLIKFKGLQVAPAELEDVLLSHPSILEAAVIGIKAAGTEVPKAYVIVRDDKVSESQLLEYVSSRVSNHKRLRGGVRFVKDIPKLPTGKVLKRILKEWSSREAKESLPQARL